MVRSICESGGVLSSVQLDAEECAYSRVASWLKSLWRGQAAHKVIEGDLLASGVLNGYEVKIEHSFETADGGRLRIDVMIGRNSSEAWSIFEMKPANERAAAAGYQQVSRYDGEMTRSGEMSG